MFCLSPFICARDILPSLLGFNLLLIMDGYSCHMSFITFSLLRENGIGLAGLPSHTSHELQPLDMSVFQPIKQEFKRLLSRHTVYSKRDAHNDIFTIYEVLCQAYHKYLTSQNEISGFCRTVI